MPNYDENQVLRDALSGLNDDIPPMPEGLHDAWMSQVRAEAPAQQTPPAKRRWTRQMTQFLSAAAAMVFIFGGTLLTRDELSGLGKTDSAPQTASIALNGKRSAANESADMDYGIMLTSNASFTVAADTADVWTTALARSVAEPAIEQKIIRTASMTIVSPSYEDSLATLKDSCTVSGGWVQYAHEAVSNATGARTATLTLRVPQDTLDTYLADASVLGRVTMRNESATDVTESYQDTAARLATQEALMDRLQALITESADLTDLLSLEAQIAETQYTIDSLRSSLNATDRKVAYATVDVTLKEETAPSITDETVSLVDRLKAAVSLGWETLVSFLADVSVFLVAALPFIGIVAAVYLAGRIIRRFKKRR